MGVAVALLLGAVVALWQELRRRTLAGQLRDTGAALEAVEAARKQAVAERDRLESLITTRDAEIARAWSAADACADPDAALRLLRYELDPDGARALPPPDAPAGP